MCGIVGSLNGNGQLDKAVLSSIRHRGPDTEGVLTWKNISLGHVRLSIVDLSEAGNQPMESECGKYALIFNGEIYNHDHLRKKLSNIRFRGHSDTETILYFLREFGIEGIKELNGIFAFAFLDKVKNKLYLSRDPFGVKPLYYYEKKGFLSAFASEIRGLEALGIKKELEVSQIESYLKLRYCPAPITLFHNIKKVRPGTVMELNGADGHVLNEILYTRVSEVPLSITSDEALEEYDRLLHNAVKRQLMSDVPVSLLLSGGVDSALLAYLVNEFYQEPIQTYTAGFEGIHKDVNEIAEASITAKWLGIPNERVLLNENKFMENLPALIKQIEEPLGSQSIFPIHFLSKKINEDGYKVTLTGQGVDEPWGGYQRYKVQEALQLLSKWPIPKKTLARVFPSDAMRRAISASGLKDQAERFTESYSIFDSNMLSRLVKRDVFEEHFKSFPQALIRERIRQLKLEKRSATSTMMILDARMNLADDLLLYTDKISMSQSIEMRVPFLDIELMRFVESLPHRMKVGLFKNKWLHKKLAEKYLPKEIIYRKKKGFYTPRKEWFKGDSGVKLQRTLNSANGAFSELFNLEEVNKYFELHRLGKVNYEKQLYLLIVLYFTLTELD